MFAVSPEKRPLPEKPCPAAVDVKPCPASLEPHAAVDEPIQIYLQDGDYDLFSAASDLSEEEEDLAAVLKSHGVNKTVSIPLRRLTYLETPASSSMFSRPLSLSEFSSQDEESADDPLPPTKNLCPTE